MNILELKTFLESFPKDRICQYGFCKPHSYRGRYDEVAFEPANNITIESMLKCIDDATSMPFSGWKGGEYWYDEETPINIAIEGTCPEDEWKNYLVKVLLSVTGENK